MVRATSRNEKIALQKSSLICCLSCPSQLSVLRTLNCVRHDRIALLAWAGFGDTAPCARLRSDKQAERRNFRPDARDSRTHVRRRSLSVLRTLNEQSRIPQAARASIEACLSGCLSCPTPLSVLRTLNGEGCAKISQRSHLLRPHGAQWPPPFDAAPHKRAWPEHGRCVRQPTLGAPEGAESPESHSPFETSQGHFSLREREGACERSTLPPLGCLAERLRDQPNVACYCRTGRYAASLAELASQQKPASGIAPEAVGRGLPGGTGTSTIHRARPHAGPRALPRSPQSQPEPPLSSAPSP